MPAPTPATNDPPPAREPLGGALAIVLGLAAAAVALAGVKAANHIVSPLLLALFVTVLVHPAGNWLRRRLPGWAAVLSSIVLAYAIIGGLGLAVGIVLARFGTVLADYSDELAVLRQQLSAWLQQLGIGGEQAQLITGGFDASSLLPLIGGALSDLAGAAGSVLLVFAICFFMALDARAVVGSLGEARPIKPTLIGALAQCAEATRRNIVVATVFGLIIAVLDTIVLILFGIPEPVLWGVLAFLTNYIPNIGFVIGLVPPAVLALLGSGPQQMVAIIVIYSVLNLGIQSGIQPKVIGDAVGLSSTLTFMSLVLWAWILGPIGALLAVPASLLVKAVLVDAIPSNQWLVPVLAGRGRDDLAAPRSTWFGRPPVEHDVPDDSGEPHDNGEPDEATTQS